MLLREVQKLKAPFPIAITLSGIFILSRASQLINVQVEISSILFESVTFLS